MARFVEILWLRTMRLAWAGTNNVTHLCDLISASSLVTAVCETATGEEKKEKMTEKKKKVSDE